MAADHQMLTALETISRWLLLKKRKTRSLSHPFGHLRVTYELHLLLVGKPVVDFIFVVIELFSLSPTVETLWAEIGRSRRFSKGWVTLSADFRVKGASPTKHCWCQKTSVIAVSCGNKIFAVRCLVFSQYTHLTDRQTDRQNCDSNTVRCITCSRTVKILDCYTYELYLRLHLLHVSEQFHGVYGNAMELLFPHADRHAGIYRRLFVTWFVCNISVTYISGVG